MSILFEHLRLGVIPVLIVPVSKLK